MTMETSTAPNKISVLARLRRDKFLYFLVLPGVVYFIIFHYLPMYGIVIAFKDYQPWDAGFMASSWVGLKHFKRFFSSVYFVPILRNTAIISGLKLLLGFPAPILLALLLNEVGAKSFKKTVQTISYLPHFISWIVIAGMIVPLFTTQAGGGIVAKTIQFLGGTPVNYFASSRHIRGALVLSHIWKGIGWGSIIYLAAISNVDPTMYDAAVIDGAGRLRQARHITLPSIKPMIIILVILNMGSLINAGFEQNLAIIGSNATLYARADIIDTYVYRGLQKASYSYFTAVGLFKGIIALILTFGANKFAKAMGEEGLF